MAFSFAPFETAKQIGRTAHFRRARRATRRWSPPPDASRCGFGALLARRGGGDPISGGGDRRRIRGHRRHGGDTAAAARTAQTSAVVVADPASGLERLVAAATAGLVGLGVAHLELLAAAGDALAVVGGGAAAHADGVDLVDVLGDGEEARH